MVPPAGPLMREHRLIERMITLMSKELGRVKKDRKVNPALIDIAVDFLRAYADRCHHGKEEDILFRNLGLKPLSAEHKIILDQLFADHAFARATVAELVAAKESYVKGDWKSIQDIESCLSKLVDLYPRHIAMEDKQFFLPCMQYFSIEEQEAMIAEFWEFDRMLIHERYDRIVKQLE